MLALFSPLVTHGLIDNTAPGLIDLTLGIVDAKAPVHLRLKGNCRHDIAGCRLSFQNPAAVTRTPVPELIQLLRESPHGCTAGDITFSRRVPEPDNRAALGNWLYIEFFVGAENRVLLEFPAPPFELSLPERPVSEEEDAVQHMLNLEAMRAHVRANVQSYRGPTVSTLTPDMPDCRWDYILNRAEAYMAIFPSIHTKYGPEPGGYLSAAFVTDREEFLDKMANEDEAHMPPADSVINNNWEVADFMRPEQADALFRAMHHRLFREASHMTAIVQNKILNGPAYLRDSSESTDFINTYAGIVSHILSTLLLMEDESEIKTTGCRLSALIRRSNALTDKINRLPHFCHSPLQQAAHKLLSELQSLHASICH